MEAEKCISQMKTILKKKGKKKAKVLWLGNKQVAFCVFRLLATIKEVVCDQNGETAGMSVR